LREKILNEEEQRKQSEKKFLELKPIIAQKYADAYINLVEEVLTNQNYHTYSGPITERVAGNIFGNYNISGNEKSSNYSIPQYATGINCLYITLKFDRNEPILFNVNQDKESYDESMVNKVLKYYGIVVKSKDILDKNVIYLSYYKNIKDLEQYYNSKKLEEYYKLINIGDSFHKKNKGMNQEEYIKKREEAKKIIQRKKKLDDFFAKKIDEIQKNKEKVAKKYAAAYLRLVNEILKNPKYTSRHGTITDSYESNIFGNYNISGKEELYTEISSHYEICDDIIFIDLIFDNNEQILFNVNEDEQLYDELMINDILYEYGIDVQSRNQDRENVIRIAYYKDKTKLEKNCEIQHTGHSLIKVKRTH